MQEVERLCGTVVLVAQARSVASGTVPELLARTGEQDFEEAFVQLAFAPQPLAAVAPVEPHWPDSGAPDTQPVREQS